MCAVSSKTSPCLTRSGSGRSPPPTDQRDRKRSKRGCLVACLDTTADAGRVHFQITGALSRQSPQSLLLEKCVLRASACHTSRCCCQKATYAECSLALRGLKYVMNQSWALEVLVTSAAAQKQTPSLLGDATAAVPCKLTRMLSMPVSQMWWQASINPRCNRIIGRHPDRYDFVLPGLKPI